MTFNDFLLKIRPLVKASGLEKKAGLPRNVITKHYTFADGKPNGQSCHVKHAPAIVRALCAVFGCIEVNGWRITCDPDGAGIFSAKYIPGRDAKVTEGKSGIFEYEQPEWRGVDDDFDFCSIFSPD